MEDSFKVAGSVTLTSYNSSNVVCNTLHIPNLVVSTGKTFIASRMSSNTANVMGFIAVGFGSEITAPTTTALQSENARASTSVTGGTASGNTVTYSSSFGFNEANGSLTEAGIFNEPSGGTMLCRTTFPAYVKTSSEVLAVSWTISIV